MPLELPDDARDEAIEAIKSYAEEHFDEPIGNLAAGGLLAFFLTEIAPSVYNQAVRDAQTRLQVRVSELDVDLQETEFPASRRRR